MARKHFMVHSFYRDFSAPDGLREERFPMSAPSRDVAISEACLLAPVTRPGDERPVRYEVREVKPAGNEVIYRSD